MKKLFILPSLLFCLSPIFSQDKNETSVIQNIESKMVRVSGGTFTMGAENFEINELPLHNVSLDSFYISSTEISQKEYSFIMEENYSKFSGDDLPVEEVSWYDAIIFCNKLSLKNHLEPAYSINGEKNPDLWGTVPRLDSTAEEKSLWNQIQWNQNADGYRLPTEAEWEYAANGASFYNGNIFSGSDEILDVAWHQNNGEQKTHICGTKQPNQLGLYDMNGNVWEWCWDWYGRYNDGGKKNPTGAEMDASGKKVRKGGSFKSEKEFCRNTNRASTSPEIRGRDLGFRIARSIPAEDSVVLTKNTVVITSDEPYSLFIQSYKEEQDAKNNQARLANENVDSYILKKYSNERFFSFDLHTGNFKNKDEAEEAQKLLKEKGLNSEIQNANEFKNSLDLYDQIINQQTVSYDNGQNNYPNIFSEKIKNCLSNMPATSDYQIDYVEIVDFDNLKSANMELKSDYMIKDFFAESNEKIHAATYAEYLDSIYDKKITVIIAQADAGSFSDRAQTFASTFMDGVYEEGSFSINIPSTDLTCSVVQAYGQMVLSGNNPDGSIYILMFAQDFNSEQLTDFLTQAYGFDSLLIYPQLRKTLCVLPENVHAKRDFLKFKLYKMEENYAEERDNVPWSTAVVGRWYSSADFVQDDKLVATAFFQMGYDYVASYTHKLFKNEKSSFVDKKNYPVLLNGLEAWYQDMDDSNELSFNTKSYIIAIDSYDGKMLSEQELKDYATDLKVW